MASTGNQLGCRSSFDSVSVLLCRPQSRPLPVVVWLALSPVAKEGAGSACYLPAAAKRLPTAGWRGGAQQSAYCQELPHVLAADLTIGKFAALTNLPTGKPHPSTTKSCSVAEWKDILVGGFKGFCAALLVASRQAPPQLAFVLGWCAR